MKCYFVDRDKPRMVRDHHDDGCPGGECQGCQPCAKDHCFVGWYGDRGDCETHAVTVCPSCVAKVREHLGEIVRLSGSSLLEQVLSTGDPDSEAADLLGPTADPRQWRQRSDYGHIYEPDSRLGWFVHPESVLGWFDMIVTKHLGHTRTTRITVPRAADYLGRNLHFLAADVEFDFPDLANALADCRVHLERVLHDGEQVEEGAPCMGCGNLLRRVYGGNELPWSHRDGSKPRAIEDCWACGRCREARADKDYGLSVAYLHRENAEWLTDAEMEVRTGIKATTVRSWGREDGPVGRKRDSGRTVYAVADVERVAREKGMMAS